MADSEIRPIPEEHPTLAAIARLMQRADEFARKPFGYENPPVAMVSDFLSIPPLYRTIKNYAYGFPLASGTSSISAYLPRLREDTKGAIEGAINLLPAAGPTLKATKSAARAAAPYAARHAVELAEKYGVAPTMNVIKPKGGNWLAGHVETALKPLKSVDEETAVRAMLRANPNIDREAARQFVAAESAVSPESRAINRWIDTKLDKYIRNEMGTPEDPVRALAERGVLHVNPNELNYRLNAYGKYAQPGQEFLATSDAAKMWEGASDNAINVLEASRITRPDTADIVEKNPWLNKLSPETKVYATMDAHGMARDLGFPHLIDELKAAMSPTSDLPQHLRLDPKDIDKVTVPQAVERVSKINAWRAEQAAKAEREGMMANLKAEPRLADENLQLSFVEKPGGAWVDVPETVNKEGVQLCTSIGKAGGWCTQHESHAKDYGSGKNRLATLLDSEGRPHAQAKITKDANDEDAFYAVIDDLTPAQNAAYEAHFAQFDRPPELPDAVEWMEQNAPDVYKKYQGILAEQGKGLVDITELKPPGNSFNSDRSKEYIKRDPQYKNKVTQSVLNFLNSGEWGRVADLHHYDIVDLKDPNSLLNGMKVLYGDESNRRIGQEFIDAFNHAVGAEPNAPRFMTQRQLREFIGPVEPLEGYAEGGLKKPSPYDELEPTFGQRMGAAASDLITKGLINAYDLAATDRSKMSAAHKIYLDTFGTKENREPITKEFFSPEELSAISDLIARKGGGAKGSITYDDYIALNKVRPMQKYPGGTFTGRMDPYHSVNKALGQFNYEYDPKTKQYKILDEYDFNFAVRTPEGQRLPDDFAGDYIADDLTDLYSIARKYAGRKMPPGKGRKVDLSVPRKAEGGLFKYDPDEIAQLAASVSEGLAPYGVRHSGEGVKGKGYFGVLPNKAGGVSTEISAEDESGEYPLIVPTLSAEELDALLADQEPTEEMHSKARSWANTRRARGQSPFAEPNELRMPRPGYAAGGLVADNEEPIGEDQAGINRMVQLEQGGALYAEGGLVQYDPTEIDAIASKLKEEFYA